MPDLSTNLPLSEASDAAEVSLALENARSLWSQGNPLESVRWIQRAAENAESSGNDLRALMLARAAADLRAEVNVRSEPPGSMNEAAALTPYDDFTEQTIVDSPASSLARAAVHPGLQITETPTASASQAPALVTPTLAPTQALASPATQHQAVRVYLLDSDAAKRQFSVRVLAQGESAPPGCTEALLVSLDAKLPLI